MTQQTGEGVFETDVTEAKESMSIPESMRLLEPSDVKQVSEPASGPKSDVPEDFEKEAEVYGGSVEEEEEKVEVPDFFPEDVRDALSGLSAEAIQGLSEWAGEQLAKNRQLASQLQEFQAEQEALGEGFEKLKSLAKDIYEPLKEAGVLAKEDVERLTKEVIASVASSRAEQMAQMHTEVLRQVEPVITAHLKAAGVKDPKAWVASEPDAVKRLGLLAYAIELGYSPREALRVVNLVKRTGKSKASSGSGAKRPAAPRKSVKKATPGISLMLQSTPPNLLKEG